MTKFFPSSKNAFSYYGNIYLILAVQCWFREIITRKEDDGDVFLSVLVRDNVYKKIKWDKNRHIVFCTDTLSCSPHMGWLCFSSLQRCLLTQNALHLVSLTAFKGAHYFVSHPPPAFWDTERLLRLFVWVHIGGHGWLGAFHSLEWLGPLLPRLPRTGPGLGHWRICTLSCVFAVGQTWVGHVSISYTHSLSLWLGRQETQWAVLEDRHRGPVLSHRASWPSGLQQALRRDSQQRFHTLWPPPLLVSFPFYTNAYEYQARKCATM